MKKILLSIGMIVTLTGAVIGGTSAFFSDTETSAGNTFRAGAVDLKVDNESYYNGAISTSTTFGPSDLGDGKLFLNFTDLKPDDEGEDTISLHVNNNDAWLCMDMSLTSNDDRSSNEPELGAGDVQEDVNNTWDGELAGLVQMFWWVDDGDNVYEVGETSLNGPAPKTVSSFFSSQNNGTTTFSADLADATTNVWTNQPGPAIGGQTYYIGKAWCYGTMTLAPAVQDNLGTDGPLAPGRVATGYTCDGTQLGNMSQSDGITIDIGFRAEQARHNGTYTCGEEVSRVATLTVNKVLITDNGGNEVISNFQLSVVGSGVTNVTSGVATQFVSGNYIVTESGISGYQASFSGDCNAAGQITLAPGDNKTCTITNNDIAPNITLIKQVANGPAVPIQFTMRIDGNVVPQNTSVPVSANSVHTISEDAFPNYSFTNVTGAGCPATIPGNVTLNEGQAITCTITNSLQI